MSAPMVENVLKQARSVSSAEFQSLCESTLSASKDARGQDFINCLRKLFLNIHSTRYDKNVPENLVQSLCNTLKEIEHLPLRPRLLCSSVLSELAPRENLHINDFSSSRSVWPIPHVLSVVACQGSQIGEYSKLIPFLVRWISTVGFDWATQTRALVFISTIAVLHQHLLTEDQIHVVSSQIADWLHNASIYQAPNPHARTIFKRDEQYVTEVDGTPSKDLFTVLSIGQYYLDDQLLNIFSFSMVYKWLQHTRETFSPMSSLEVSDSLSEDGYSRGRDRSKHILLDRCLSYCFRILDQCERKPKVQQDVDCQQAVLKEAVAILDCICKINLNVLPKAIENIKRLYNNLTAEQTHVLLQIVQFFLNHGAVVSYDCQTVYDQYFGDILATHFMDSAVAFETVMFLRDNLQSVSSKTNILTKYFPNILKILAWNPRSYLKEYVDLLPAMVTPTTALEIVHSLLDLPCLTAAMETQIKAEQKETSPLAAPEVSVESFLNPFFKPWFSFILRNESGQGDTINKLGDLHRVLKDANQSPRVFVCSQIVPVLLKLFFKLVLQDGDFSLVCHLIPVLLERVALLYDIPGFQHDVKRIFCEELVSLFKKHPMLIAEQGSEILDYIGGLRNITDREDFFVHLVWVIGEYSSVDHSTKCTPEIISKYYEALECLLYEISGLVHSASSEQKAPYTVRLITTIMAAIAKLASRCQDLIPRVLLCLTKVGQQHMDGNLEQDSRQALLDRAHELINLLKLPNIASVILSPPGDMDTGRWHTENSSLPVLLQATNTFLQNT